MDEDGHPKKWWQTVPALLSGLGTLLAGIGAVLGFFYASHTAPRDPTNAPALSAPSTVKRTPTTSGKSADADELAVTRQEHEVALPAKREYNFEGHFARLVFMLVRATVVPQTPESDMLKVTVRVFNRNKNSNALHVSNRAFRLVTEQRTYVPEDISANIAAQDSGDVSVNFYIPFGLQQTTFRMTVENFAVDVPLDLTPP